MLSPPHGQFPGFFDGRVINSSRNLMLKTAGRLVTAYDPKAKEPWYLVTDLGDITPVGC